jgi:hypothetical protein
VSAIECRLRYQSASPHLQQLYTGFHLLRKSGRVSLSQEPRRDPIRYLNDASHLRDAAHAHLDASLNGGLRLHFDTHDAQEIALGELEQCDFYFKRSFRPDVVDPLPPAQRRKVRPLGLNYRVLPDDIDTAALFRGLSMARSVRGALSALKQALDTNNRLGFEPRLSRMEAAPDLEAPPRVLFLVAAYDPYADPDRSPEKIEDRISINETRARCLRLLKQELGPAFTGGFGRSPFTVRQYGELVVPPEWTSQESYLRSVRSFPICVASTGLHGSIGWKLAEYVAFSKAILSEKPLHRIPGEFGPGSHYIEFTTPESCLEGALKLMNDTALRQKLMKNNAAYYRSHLRPDALVWNALSTALQGIDAGASRDRAA